MRFHRLVVAAAVVALAAPGVAHGATKHRIGVRVVDGQGRLFDRVTGRPFVPRGANYVRLDFALPQPHVTFTLGRYDGPRATRALRRLRAEGYNSTRVFVIGECPAGCAGLPGRRAISRAYVRNVVDFLRRAKKQGIQVILTMGFPPGSYGSLIGTAPLVDGVNRVLLTEGGIRAFGTFWRDFVRELRRQKAPFEAILAYDVTNENAFVNDHAPFTLTSGVVTAPGGARYDLAVTGEKERLMDDAMVYWVDRVRAAIRRVDPTALVTASFFEPEGPNPTRPGDTRILRTRGVIERSQLDFVDLHAYPGGLPLQQVMENYGVAGPTRKPLVMGELGAFKQAFASAAEGAAALEAWQAQSCAYGFDGWLLWTWDSDEQTELWNGLSEGGPIGRALSPKSRPDPCTGAAAATNLALGKPVTASSSLPDGPPSLAVDGNATTPWLSGQDPPGWIEIDLGLETTVARVRLVVSQFPEGNTLHRILGRGESGDFRLLAELSGFTRGDQRIEAVAPQSWQGIRLLRIETVSSPSWSSWKEIEVFGPG
jgi:hypothetical protein